MTDKKPPDTSEIADEKLKEVSGGKLTVGKPVDKSEREADQTANKVLGQ